MFKWLDRLPNSRFALILILPTVIFLAMVIVYPVITLVANALSSFNQYLVPSFVGLENFFDIFSDRVFWEDLGRSLLYTGGSLFLFLIIGFAIALSLNKIERNVGGTSQTLLRGLSLLPWAIPPVTATMMWRWALNSQYGIVNDLLIRMDFIGDPINWLTHGTTAMLVIIVVDAWIRIPFVALLLLAGLKAIPDELYECAKIDGAGTVARFRHISIPLLRYPMSIALALQTMFAFRFFDIMSVMTGGGPGSSTELLVKYMYDSAFKEYAFGIASAVSIVMLLICFLVVVFYWKALKLEV
jgi:multiple sugar transport system permease protein